MSRIIETFKPASPVVINNNTIHTGIDLTKGDKLILTFVDQASKKPWPDQPVNLEAVRASGRPQMDFYMSPYDNDFMQGFIQSWKRGTIRFSDHGRAFSLFSLVLIHSGD